MAGRVGQPGIAFAYRGGKTMLHRAPAGLKLLSMLALSIAAYSSLAGLAAAALVILAGSIIARIPPHELLHGSKPLVILSLCILLVKTFEPGAPGITTPEIIVFNVYIPDLFIPGISGAGFFAGILTALRILASFAAAALLFAVTTMRELRLSLGAIEKRVFGSGRISLGISLMLGFIPRFFELWETMNLACDARSCKKGLRRLILLIPLVTERMMEAAADTALALEARGLE